MTECSIDLIYSLLLEENLKLYLRNLYQNNINILNLL